MAYGKAREVFAAALEGIRAEGLYKSERLIASPQGGRVLIDGMGAGREVINLCANNYLGLSSHPEVIRAAHEGLDRRGFGMSSVRFICGTQDIHRELEERVSAYLGTEDCCLFASCFDANAAIFEALLTPEDGIFSDRLVHASIIDGVRLSKAQRFIWEHANLEDLEAKLEAAECRLKLIVTDGVFSMDGDMAKLDGICEIASRHGALVMVDDSHATGFLGPTGRGTHEHFGVMDQVDIITTTFGKALGGATGGCVAGRSEIVELMKQRGRPYLFSNALMPAVVYATLRVLDLLSETADRRERLWANTRWWRDALTRAGFELKPGDTPIVPVMLYDARLAQAFSAALFERGVYAVGFFYPVVPKGQARIRTQLSAALTRQDLEEALEAFVAVGRELEVIRG